jgi:hypothetical protein
MKKNKEKGRFISKPNEGRDKDTKVNVKLSLCLSKHHTIKTYWGNGGVSLRILDPGTRWR